jgi:acetolactate synthase regulatory subunit
MSALMPAATTTAAQPAADTRPHDPTRRVAFALRADADPGLLPRVLELFAKRGLVPGTLHADHRTEDDTLAVEVEVTGMVRAESDHVANCLRQIPGVTLVLASERRAEAAVAGCCG